MERASVKNVTARNRALAPKRDVVVQRIGVHVEEEHSELPRTEQFWPVLWHPFGIVDCEAPHDYSGALE